MLEELPIPLIIYRVYPEEAYQLGILSHTITDISDLSSYESVPMKAIEVPALKPIAALSNPRGIERSREEGYLWLLHPQCRELRPYRGKPPLLALENSYGFCEAYLPHTSSAVPHEWDNENSPIKYQSKQATESQFALAESRLLDNGKKQNLLGILLQYFCDCKQQGKSLSYPKPHNISVVVPEKEIAKLPLEGRDFVWLEAAISSFISLAKLQKQNKPEIRYSEVTEYFAQGLWSLLAALVSSYFQPEIVLDKLSAWFDWEQNYQNKIEQYSNFADDIPISKPKDLKDTAEQKLSAEKNTSRKVIPILKESGVQQETETTAETSNKGWDLELKAWRSRLYGPQN